MTGTALLFLPVFNRNTQPNASPNVEMSFKYSLLLHPFLITIVAIVIGYLFWRFEWHLAAGSEAQSSNLTEENPISYSNPTDTEIASKPTATHDPYDLATLEKQIEHDKRVLSEYPWASYKSLPPAIQETVEAAVLKNILAVNGDISHDSCSAFLKDEPNVQALLLQGWEKGAFEDLRRNSIFLSLGKHIQRTKSRMMLQASPENPGGDMSPAISGTACDNGIDNRADDLISESLEVAEGEADMGEPEDEQNNQSSEEEDGDVDDNDDDDYDDDDDDDDYDEDADDAEGDQTDKEEEEDSEGENSREPSEQGNNIKVNFSRNKFKAAQNINVAVTVWRPRTSGEDGGIPKWYFDVVDYRATHNEIAKKRSKSTGGWFLRSKAYRKWRTTPQQRLMLCPGIPGVGKTVIASLVVDHLRTLDEDKTFVGIIYFNYKLRSQQSKLAIFEALCRQAYETCQTPKWKQGFISLYKSHEKRKSRPTDAELQSALSSCLQHYQSCYLIFDALDEYTAQYSDKEVREVISDILSLGSNVKLLITSRILGEMKATFQGLGASIEEIVGDDNDMRAYLAERVAFLKSKLDFEVSDDFSEQIVAKVIEAAKGRFLVAELGMNLLAEQLRPGELEDALYRLPNEIDDTYVRVIELIKTYPEGRRDLAMKALMWVAYAYRNLSVRELQHALATKHGRKETDKYVTPLSTITSLCAGLIVVQDKVRRSDPDDTRIVRFVHFTTQEFFGQPQSDYFSNAHQEMLSTCIAYLSITGNYILPETFVWTTTANRHLRLPFYDYSALNWGHHANAHHESLLHEVQDFLCKNDRAIDLSWQYAMGNGLGGYGDKVEKRDSNIFLAAYHDQVDALPLLCERMESFPRTKERRTPLHIAIFAERPNAVKAMLQWSASGHDNDDPAGVNVLQKSTKRRSGSKYLFLENTPDKYGRTPLSYASEMGSEPIVKLLLEHRGVKVNSKDKDGWTPFLYAARAGKETIIKLLLEHKDIALNPKDSYGHTPFVYAVGSGWESIVKLLLGYKGIDVDSKDVYGVTPLSQAARRGNVSITKLLLEHEGIEVDRKDNKGRTPFSYAAGECEASVVKLMLEHGGVEVDSVDNNGRTPLSYAAGGPHWRIPVYGESAFDTLTPLLQSGAANVNSKDNHGQTPLYYASKKLWQTRRTMKFLREHGAIDDPELDLDCGYSSTSIDSDSCLHVVKSN